MRDVILKLKASNYLNVAVIYEMKGNPSRIEFFNQEGDLILSMDITVSNSLAKGRIQRKELKLRWDFDESKFKKKDLKDKIISVLGVPEDPLVLIKTDSLKDELRQYSNSNLILVKYEDNKAVVEFHDQKGQITGPRIYIHRCRTGD